MADYRPGDRVEVHYGHGWDGKATVRDVFSTGSYGVVMDDGRLGCFKPEHLALAPWSQKPQKPQRQHMWFDDQGRPCVLTALQDDEDDQDDGDTDQGDDYAYELGEAYDRIEAHLLANATTGKKALKYDRLLDKLWAVIRDDVES